MRCSLLLIACFGFGGSTANAESPLKDDELIAALIENLDDPDVEVRQNIAAALANLGDSAVPALIDALNHAKRERRVGAALALGIVRPAAKTAIPGLLKALKDADDGVRRQASYALSRIVGQDFTAPPKSRQLPNVPPLDPPPGPATTGGSR